MATIIKLKEADSKLEVRGFKTLSGNISVEDYKRVTDEYPQLKKEFIIVEVTEEVIESEE